MRTKWQGAFADEKELIITEVVMPDFGQDAEEFTINRWFFE